MHNRRREGIRIRDDRYRSIPIRNFLSWPSHCTITDCPETIATGGPCDSHTCSSTPLAWHIGCSLLPARSIGRRTATNATYQGLTPTTTLSLQFLPPADPFVVGLGGATESARARSGLADHYHFGLLLPLLARSAPEKEHELCTDMYGEHVDLLERSTHTLLSYLMLYKYTRKLIIANYR